jgi:predicted DCC family thiol-disulfide oxidoreductase YuxK
VSAAAGLRHSRVPVKLAKARIPAAKAYGFFVEQRIQVKAPPAKPVMIFDGDCGFCRFWIERWRRQSGGSIEYTASQEPDVRRRFPEIPQHAFDTSVQYVDIDGTVYHGAEGVLRSRTTFGKRWLYWIYRNVPGARFVFEAGYAFIASHRTGFSKLNKLVFGTAP